MLSNKVKEIMTREVLTVGVTDLIAEVLEVMAAKNVGRAIVTDHDRPVGIFTEADVLRRVATKKIDLKKNAIKRVMTSPIRSVQEEAHILEALGKMYKGRFRHMLVRGDKKETVGLISMRRILKLAVELGRDLNESETIGSIMTGRLLTVDPSQSVFDILGAMTKGRVTCVVVCDDGKPLGVFTERDVLRRVAVRNLDTRKIPIKEVMTADPVIMVHSALIGQVLAEMYQRDFRNMPIRGESGELLGMVSMGDILKYAKALDVDQGVRSAWQEIREYWDSEIQYTPG